MTWKAAAHASPHGLHPLPSRVGLTNNYNPVTALAPSCQSVASSGQPLSVSDCNSAPERVDASPSTRGSMTGGGRSDQQRRELTASPARVAMLVAVWGG